MKALDKMEQHIQKKTSSLNICCDQVAWLLDIFDRYLPKENLPAVSQKREMLKHGMLYEVMDILNLGYEDECAKWNATPAAARREIGK